MVGVNKQSGFREGLGLVCSLSALYRVVVLQTQTSALHPKPLKPRTPLKPPKALEAQKAPGKAQKANSEAPKSEAPHPDALCLHLEVQGT